MKALTLPGLSDFKMVWDLQKELIALRERDEIPDTILFLEHKPVITRGRGLQRKDAKEPLGERHRPLAFTGMDYFEIERGGDLTYHGPGQLVIYPIGKLGQGSGIFAEKSIERFIRALEGSVISLLSEYGLQGKTQPGAAGVWVGPQKLASVGIAVRKWITYHGIAINVVNDLSPFLKFSPCGFGGEVMTNLTSLLPSVFSQDEAQWPRLREGLEQKLAGRLMGIAAPMVLDHYKN